MRLAPWWARFASASVCAVVMSIDPNTRLDFWDRSEARGAEEDGNLREGGLLVVLQHLDQRLLLGQVLLPLLVVALAPVVALGPLERQRSPAT